MKSIEDQIKLSAQKALKLESKSIDLLATNLPQISLVLFLES